jgi:hypothetical protein
MLSKAVNELRAIAQDIKTLRLKNLSESPAVDTLILTRKWMLDATHDLQHDPTITIRAIYRKPIQSKIVMFIYKAHCCRFSNLLFNLPGKSIWWYNRREIFRSKKSYKNILFFATALEFLEDKKLYRKLKNKYPDSHFYIFIWDTIKKDDDGIWNIYQTIQQSGIFEQVLTFDKNDAEKFGWLPCLCYYSKRDIAPEEITSDLYFIGKISNGREYRFPIVNECHRLLSQKGLCATFKLLGNSQTDRRGIQFIDQPIEYMHTLHDIQYCNCILEIVKEGQAGPTLRYFEAICYNKKLLTNNSAVVDLPFYDERYIHVFKTVSDIDIDWVARREPVDYHYDGCFSPVHMVEMMRLLSAG